MLRARHLDLAAHELRASGHGYYTISSAGHEGNVVLGNLTRATDPALLHYRSAALYLERARAVPEVDAALDIALSLVAAADDPCCSGRHKVFGSRSLGVIPKTSTIASHLPRAVGLAFAIERRQRLGLDIDYPADAVAIASFGDASVNHSTAQGAFNAASWVAHQNLKLPLLLICEDNELGISVRTPPGWMELRLHGMPHVAYFEARGWRLDEAFDVAARALQHCRRRRAPAILHLRFKRLWGHAGSDVDHAYRTPEEIRVAEEHDPVLCAALDLVEHGVSSADDILALERAAQRYVAERVLSARHRPKLGSRAAVLGSLPFVVRSSTEDAARLAPEGTAPTKPQAPSEGLSLAQGLNVALREILERHPEAIAFGEDIAKKGGVYGITKGLAAQFGPLRVFNTLLDEQTILGLALGSSLMGLLPIAEIQYLAYLHNAEDQLRGEGATLPFFSNDRYDNPMIVRIAGFAYQKGFGGHFHNDNAVAVLRDIPGIAVAVPARADDAYALLRSAARLALKERRIAVILEPIALYHTRDLHEAGDMGWTAPPTSEVADVGRARLYREDCKDLLIVTYGNGLYLSLRAARKLDGAHGIRARVLDLRWLSPLPLADIERHARDVGRVLIVDECRRSGSVSEALLAHLVETGASLRMARVTSEDCFIPIGEAADHVLVRESDVVEAALQLTTSNVSARPRTPS